MNNWCICWFLTHIFTGILIFKGLTARRLYKSFGVKGLIMSLIVTNQMYSMSQKVYIYNFKIDRILWMGVMCLVTWCVTI
jgi:hypothetical protein